MCINMCIPLGTKFEAPKFEIRSLTIIFKAMPNTLLDITTILSVCCGWVTYDRAEMVADSGCPLNTFTILRPSLWWGLFVHIGTAGAAGVARARDRRVLPGPCLNLNETLKGGGIVTKWPDEMASLELFANKCELLCGVRYTERICEPKGGTGVNTPDLHSDRAV